MSVIADVFKSTKAYIGYLTAGDGGFDQSLAVMTSYAENGIDIIEVGVPFSDPVADGPVIQAAAQRALHSGFHLDDVLRLIREFRKHYTTPIILFGYFNPILQTGSLDAFFKQAQQAGVNGSLVVDLPLEEGDDYHMACVNAGIDPIYIIAPSTPVKRISQIAQRAQGMLYYACRKGVTGARDGLPDDLTAKLAAIKAHTEIPVAVGFGVASRETAEAILQLADGVVVGSLLVKAAAEQSLDQLGHLIRSIDPR